MEKSVDQGQTAWGPNILLGLIIVQAVCKGFQQRKPADKELFMQCTLTFDIWAPTTCDIYGQPLSNQHIVVAIQLVFHCSRHEDNT